MAFRELAAKRRYPKKTSARYKQLDGLRAALQGTLFDVLTHSFDEEETAPGNDIPVKERRPSVYYNIFKILVDSSSSLTFGEAHAPSLRVEVDPNQNPELSGDIHTALEGLMEELRLDKTMLRSMVLGAPGSVLLVLRALPDKYPWVEIIEGQFCKPYYDPADPRKLKKVDQIYPVTAEQLDLAGYEGDFDASLTYWIKVTYDINGKFASLPMKEKDYEKLGQTDDLGKKIVWQVDEERSYDNPFDFLPVIWVKNIDTTSGIDGAPTIPVEVVDISIAISYALSMSTRGYEYTADPVMMVKAGTLRTTIPLAGGLDDASQGGNFVRSPSKRLMLSADGDASMLEISAQGLKASDEHVQLLREYAMELAAGMKSEAKDSGGMQSGKAFDKLYLALVWLVEKLRSTYGDTAYVELIKMILSGVEAGVLDVPGLDLSALSSKMRLRCTWPEWDTPTGGDMQAEMNGIATAVGSTPTLPVPFITVEQAATKAASLLRLGDKNRAAAQVLRNNNENPPLSARDSAEMSLEAKAKQAAAKPTAK